MWGGFCERTYASQLPGSGEEAPSQNATAGSSTFPHAMSLIYSTGLATGSNTDWFLNTLIMIPQFELHVSSFLADPGDVDTRIVYELGLALDGGCSRNGLTPSRSGTN
jgi:hypothetical protein